MINPGQIMKIKNAWDRFVGNHPKFPMFIQAVKANGINEGTIIDVTVTTPEGKSFSTNVKVTASDLELFQELSKN